MMRGVCERLPDLTRDLVYGPLALRQNVDDFSTTPVPQSVGNGRERVEEGVLCLSLTHLLKISLEYASIHTIARRFD